MKKIFILCFAALSVMLYSCEKEPIGKNDKEEEDSGGQQEEKDVRKYSGILASGETLSHGYFMLHFESENNKAKVVYGEDTYEMTNSVVFTGAEGEIVNFSQGQLNLECKFDVNGFPIIWITIGEEEHITIGGTYPSTDAQPARIYIGQGGSTNMNDYINQNYSFILSDEDYWMQETVTASSNPIEDGVGGTWGKGGVFTETESSITFQTTEGDLTFHKQGDQLLINETGPDNYSLYISLTKVN